NNYSTDYHALVHTPTEEDGPILGDEDYSPEGDQEYFTYASASQENLRDEDEVLVDSGASEQGGPSTSDDDKATEQRAAVTSAIEAAAEDEEADDEDADEGDQSEAHPTDSVTDLVQDVSPARSLLDQPLVTPVTTAELEQAPAKEKTGKKGAKSPVTRVFSKLKLRRSSSSTSSSPSPSTPSSPPASPMLLGRITNRLKITRTKEASTSSTTKVESLKVSSEPSVEATVASVTAAEAAAATEQDLQLDIHETVVMDDGNESDDQEPLILTEEPMEMRLPAAQPVAIPSTSGTEAWVESPTLHQTDASAGTAMSGQTLLKLGRSSTVGSTVGGESETGSVKSNGSGKEASDAQQPQQEEPKRKGSMMKKIEKFGKIIKSEKRKSSGGDSYLSRRLSRRGSATLQNSADVEKAH
ncbi:hypothetical protein BGX31_001680, partial [Mortierella sp. GBA43]